MGLVVLVAYTIRQRVVMAAADRVERLPPAETKRLGHMAVVLAVATLDTTGNHLMIPEDQSPLVVM
jgi:hypothetical protein